MIVLDLANANFGLSKQANNSLERTGDAAADARENGDLGAR
jgi:hypothetical protein